MASRSFMRVVAAATAAVMSTNIGLFAQPSQAVAAGALPSGGMSSDEVNTLINSYGDASGEWAGGDGTASVLLPDGRLVWLFSDTFVGAVNADHSLSSSAALVNNTAVVQDGTQMVATLTGGTTADPVALVPTGAADEFYWVGDAVVEGGTLQVIYNRFKRTGSGPLDFTLLGSALASFSLPSLALDGVAALPLGSDIAWGSSSFDDNGYTYIYGSEYDQADGLRFAHLARVPAGGLGGAWQFWTGSVWSASESESARLLSGVGTAFGVQKVGSQYVLVTVDTNLPFNSWTVAYTAPSPTGPFSGPTYLFQAPEPLTSNGKPIVVYDAHLHPELARTNKLLVSYNVNSLNQADIHADVSLYRPRFAEVDWPPPVPDPSAVPEAPTAVTATADAEGRITVAWQAPAGSGLDYWVYRRDVTAGQTHFVREMTSTSQTTFDMDFLRDGHEYEIYVTAANTSGESAASNVVTATAHLDPPAAPANVSVTADIVGRAAISWTGSPNVWNYRVWMRDVTAGETTFTTALIADGSQTSANVEWLEDGHGYEFCVTATNGGGDSPQSSTVSVTAHLSVPAAPTGLTATANQDGTIALSWTAPGPDLWYWVYQRDVTASEPDFTRLPLPITAGTSMTAGYLTHNHEYEYKVTAINRIGESSPSTVVQVTAHYPIPAAPSALTATPGDGQVSLSWTASGTPGVWYLVYQRDVTAGETEFTQLPLPITECCTTTAGFLANGHTYEFKVSATGQGGESVASDPVQSTPQVPLPGQVTGTTAVAMADGTIKVSWDSVSDVWFDVYMRDVTAGETGFTRLPYPVTACCSFTAGDLVHNHDYQFKIAATNAAGAGPLSSPAEATSFYQPPAAPTNLRGVSAGDGTIDLTWDAPGPGNFYYWAYWRDITTGEATFTKAAYPTDKTTVSLGLLRDGDEYEFQVTASSQGGEGSPSDPVRVVSRGGVPEPASGLTVTAGDGQATLQWTASTTPDVYYHVYQRDVTAGESFQQLPLPVAGITATPGYLINGHDYEFYVTATNSAGDSAGSNKVTARPMPPIPQPPTNLSATSGDGKVTLQWTASTTSNVYYWIEWRSNGGQWQRLNYPVGTCCSFTLSPLNNGTTYEFRVFANNLSGDSLSASNTASSTPMPPPAQPPTGLTAVPGVNKVTLHWTASPTPDVWYWVYLRDVTTGGSWQKLSLPIATCCTFDIDYLVNGHTYEFKISAYNITSESATTAAVSASPQVDLTEKPILQGASTGEVSATLWWSPVANAAGYYIEQRNLSAGATTWTRLPYPVAKTNFTPELLDSASWYRFRVVPMNGAQTGPASSPIEIRTRGGWDYKEDNALGDSYSAGVGGGNEEPLCFRSPSAWPKKTRWWIYALDQHLIACNGAVTADVWGTQLGEVKVNGRTLITMTIGGNDVGFGPNLMACLKMWDCTSKEGQIAADIDNLEPTLESLYRGIRSRAPGADILVAGYPLLIVDPSRNPDCGLAGPLLRDKEIQMIRRLALRLDSVIATAATAAGVTAATWEVIGQFNKHEACATQDDEFIHGVVYTFRDSSFHPNTSGQQAYASAVDAKLAELNRYGMVRR